MGWIFINSILYTEFSGLKSVLIYICFSVSIREAENRNAINENIRNQWSILWRPIATEPHKSLTLAKKMF